MNTITIVEQILTGLNSGIGFAGSVITIYDHFKNRDKTRMKEISEAMRDKSKKAYHLYCEYRKYRENDIGVPLEEDILGYWESCLKRDTLPGVADMVSSHIASKEEAEIMSAYLLEAWMEVPDFVNWMHDIAAQHKLDELSETLTAFRKSIEGISKLAEDLKNQNINNNAYSISPNRIVDAKYSCTDLDIKHYYMVDNRFMTMFKVISAGQDVPHRKARQKLEELIGNGHPVIIAGNGGLGKTSLMMYAAVQWASCGRVAVWLSLSGEDVITEQKAAAFWGCLSASIPAGQRGLLCIDNPYEGKVSFSNLQKMWPANGNIQLLLTERANRLTLLADPDRDSLLYWFDDARMILLEGLKQSRQPYRLKDYTSSQFPESQERRKQILEKCTLFLVRDGIVKEKDRQSSIQMILKQYGRPTVSLVELIYRTLFELKKKASKPEAVKLDWEEWEDFIESEFGKGQSYTRKELYGVIAALKVFHTPITISLFCKYFDLKERKLKHCLEERLMSYHNEPVIYNGNTLQPKHDVIAELFFLFHEKTVSINSIMLELLDCMDENEIETLLKNMVVKREFQKGQKYHVGQIRYWDYMDKIYGRMKEHSCNLSETGKAYLCLGYLWSRFQHSSSMDPDFLNELLNKTAPEADGTLPVAKLYTEWGIWARSLGDYALAEEKYRIVIENYPKASSLPSRTELGRLLSKQKGREKEAEDILREAAEIEPRHIQSRTELGKLLSKQKGREEEAEKFLREAIKIDPKNLHPHTELGKLLSKQKGREKEAEKFLREAMKIEPKHIQSRTELGKLLSKQKGREKEAEDILREVMKIAPKDLQSRTELGKLLSKQKGREKEAEDILQEVIEIDFKNLHARTVLAKLYEDQNRQKKAVTLYQEVCKYNPGDRYGERGLARLKEYIKD